MKNLDEFNLNLELILTDPSFRSYQSTASSLLLKMKKSTKFNCDQLLSESNDFFLSLKSNHPEFYSILLTTQKEINQVAFEKKFNSRIIID